MQLYILSGPIHSGKTTYLLNYVEQHKKCVGILSPVKEGKRFFYSIESKEQLPMEAASDEKDIFEIGRYKFSKLAFEWAISQIKKNKTTATELLIVDEIGPLELKGEGFSELVKEILNNHTNFKNVLLVVRENAVKEVISYFKLNAASIHFWNWNPFLIP